MILLRRLTVLPVLLFAAAIAWGPAQAQPALATPATAAAPAAASKSISCATTATPRSRDYFWMSIARWKEMHAEDLAVADKGDTGLLFLGDSITEGWPAALFNASFGEYKPANFGIGGDHTGNVLWRLQENRYAKLKPKAIVLLIGVNNFGHCGETPEQVFSGVRAVVEVLRRQYPQARILLNAVLPTQEKADGPVRQQVLALNKLLVTLQEEPHVLYRDYGQVFLQPDGSIAKELMPDFLHLSAKGYQLWSDAMLPDVRALMK